ncbi:MAG: hypothetical protein AB7O60_09665, partial [Variibacter sp.]
VARTLGYSRDAEVRSPFCDHLMVSGFINRSTLDRRAMAPMCRSHAVPIEAFGREEPAREASAQAKEKKR